MQAIRNNFKQENFFEMLKSMRISKKISIKRNL